MEVETTVERTTPTGSTATPASLVSRSAAGAASAGSRGRRRAWRAPAGRQRRSSQHAVGERRGTCAGAEWRSTRTGSADAAHRRAPSKRVPRSTSSSSPETHHAVEQEKHVATCKVDYAERSVDYVSSGSQRLGSILRFVHRKKSSLRHRRGVRRRVRPEHRDPHLQLRRRARPPPTPRTPPPRAEPRTPLLRRRLRQASARHRRRRLCQRSRRRPRRLGPRRRRRVLPPRRALARAEVGREPGDDVRGTRASALARGRRGAQAARGARRPPSRLAGSDGGNAVLYVGRGERRGDRLDEGEPYSRPRLLSRRRGGGRPAAPLWAVAAPRAALLNASTATCRRSAECDASRFAEFTARHSVSAFTVTRVSSSASFL